MGLKGLFKSKRTPFDELWKQVEGIPEGVKKQIASDLSEKTKKRLEKHSPKEIETIINEAFAEINHGSVEQIDSLIRRIEMGKKKKKKIIINALAIVIIIVVFINVNINILNEQKKNLALISDGSSYCYGIDSLNRDGDTISINGWFLELRSVMKKPMTVSDDAAELKIALVPLTEAHINTRPENAVFLNVLTMKDNRSDVNEYLKCEYDYSKCGFSATIDVKDLDLEMTSYRLVFKPDAMKTDGILSSVYLTKKGIEYTDPNHNFDLDTLGTDLDRIVKNGVRLVSRPEFGCYVYQLEDKLYWIADEDFTFCDDGRTYIQYQMETTQVDKLPADRLRNNWFWSNIGGCFEDYEVTNQLDCGKYRVMMRNIPQEYSVTRIITGYYQDGWVWESDFRPCYACYVI